MTKERERKRKGGDELYIVFFREGEILATPIKFNEVDGKTNRVSHMGTYDIINNCPR